MTEPTTLCMVEAINLALHRAMADDPDVVVLGEDVGPNGGVFRATLGLHERFGFRRVMDTPLAETLITGMAVAWRPGPEAGSGNPVHGVHLRRDGASDFPPAGCAAAGAQAARWSYVRHGAGIHAPEHHGEAPRRCWPMCRVCVW